MINRRLVDSRESVRVLPMPQLALTRRGTHRSRGLVSEDLALCARVLCISSTELAAELDGRSIADVAENHRVSPSIVIDALLARSLLRVAASVDAGNLEPEYSLEVFSRLAERAFHRVYRPVGGRVVW
jgi:hypothetical protein